MKQILILLILFSAFQGYSQKCDSSIQKTVDRFTNKVTYFLKNPIERISVDKKIIFHMDISRDENGTLILIGDVKIPDFGCTDETSKLYFIFNDDSRFECGNNKSLSCNGLVLVFLNKYFEANKVLLDKLSKLLVTAIKIQGTTNSYELDINKKEAEKFRASVKCISE